MELLRRQALWRCALRTVSSIFFTEKSGNFHFPVENDEDYLTISSLVSQTAGILNFEKEAQGKLLTFTKAEQVVIISFQHVSELDFTRVWKQIYKPYNSKYGVFTPLNESVIRNNIIAEVRKYVVDGKELTDYKQVAVYNKQKEIVDWFIVDNAAIPILQKLQTRFIYQNNRPFCSKVKKFVVDILFEKKDGEEFVYMNDPNDLRFRSIAVGDLGAKLYKDRKQKEAHVEPAIPVYKLDLSHYFTDLQKGMRHPNVDVAKAAEDIVQY